MKKTSCGKQMMIKEKSYLMSWIEVAVINPQGGVLKKGPLFAKWWWRYREEEEALWREVIVSKYGEDECLKRF